MIWERLFRPFFFAKDAEEAHERVIGALSRWTVGGEVASALLNVEDERLQVRLGPLTFRNPVGLAAGLDKHGTAAQVWPWLGFGFSEIGTVTPRPQPGNPRPRLFRLPADAAIINRMGFNGPGAEAVARHLARAERSRRADAPRGLNVGKNKDTPPEETAADHRACIERLRPFADYFVINVSSPNTPGLRALQQPAFLEALVADAVQAARGTPVFVKIAPDWAHEEDLVASLGALVNGGAFGLVATNTTLARDALRSDPALVAEAGGLSGAPLKSRALDVLRTVRRHVGPDLPVIGAGGISTAADALERLAAGADLVQIYTAFVYRGPLLPMALNRGLLRALPDLGLEDLRGLRTRSAAAAAAGSGYRTA